MKTGTYNAQAAQKQATSARSTRARVFWRDNGLSLVLLGLFFGFFIAQIFSGWLHYNEEQLDHQTTPIALAEYFKTGDFIEATAENWESEFLQMAAYVLLTIGLFQRGSSESRRLVSQSQWTAILAAPKASKRAMAG